MKTQTKIAKLILVTLAVLLMPLMVMAASAAHSAASAPAPADIGIMWNALIAVLVPVAVAILKKFLPNIPTALLPIGASLLGVLANWLLAKAGTIPSSSWELGALCGAAGVGVREIVDQSFGSVKSVATRMMGGKK